MVTQIRPLDYIKIFFGGPIVDYIHDNPKVRGFTEDHTVALVYGWYHKYKL